MKSLYAYFGLLGNHTIDSPGHNFYQIGLIDSIRQHFGEEKFDFFSYYPEELLIAYRSEVQYGNTQLGELFVKYHTSLIDKYLPNFEAVLENIRTKQYSRLYLKARFRNLSTLAKKWKDAKQFEEIIQVAIASGYSPDEIIILDTDLSLPKKFIDSHQEKVRIWTPSIDFPGISHKFLEECTLCNWTSTQKGKHSVFFGNIDTSSYKAGNQKSEILLDALHFLSEFHKQSDESYLYLVAKEKDLEKNSQLGPGIFRFDREKIWHAMESSIVMLNVTKPKYEEVRFIPARVYEALIFGMIPVSYGFAFLSQAFSFNTIDDLEEIVKYLHECEPEDLRAAYLNYVKSFFEYSQNLEYIKV